MLQYNIIFLRAVVHRAQRRIKKKGNFGMRYKSVSGA